MLRDKILFVIKLQNLKQQVSFRHPSRRNEHTKMCETHPDDYWVFSKMADLLSLICIPWSSTFQDGGWVKFPTLGTFRMSNSLPACASLGVIPVGCNGFDSCNVWISALEPSWTFVTSFIYRLIFTFNPQRLCDGIGWGIRSQFFPIGFFGLSYQAAHFNSLAWVTLFRNICIPFFSYDVELCMIFGRH